VYEFIFITQAGRALVADANAAAMRDTLGLGTAAVADADDFEAAGGGSSAPYVLEFDGEKKQVSHPGFWPDAVQLPNKFYWEAWLMPNDADSCYWLIDGFGGAHAFGGGFAGGSGGLNLLSLLLWDGTSASVHTADDGLYDNEWGHVAWAWDGANLWAYAQGIPVAKIAWTDPRKSVARSAGGGGDLFIGGSDHNNFKGRIAAARGWDGYFPGSTFAQWPFGAQWPFSPNARPSATVSVPCDFLAEFVVPGRWLIPDLSPSGCLSDAAAISGTVAVTNASKSVVGTSTTFSLLAPGQTVTFAADLTGTRYIVGLVTDETHLTLRDVYAGSTNASTTLVAYEPKIRHSGYLFGSGRSCGRGFIYDGASTATPEYVQDATFPFQTPGGAATPPTWAPTAPSTPGGAKIFDSFSRRNKTLCYDEDGGLGTTEAGSLGPLTWSYGALDGPTVSKWGVFHGRAVYLEPQARGAAWVTNNSANMDVRVKRNVGTAGVGYHIGIAFRVVDRANFWYAFSWGADPLSQSMRCGAWVAGADVGAPSVGDWYNIDPTANFTTMRVVTSGTTITFYTDPSGDGVTFVQCGQLTGETQFQSATGVGLYSGGTAGAGTSGLDRWDDFTVF